MNKHFTEKFELQCNGDLTPIFDDSFLPDFTETRGRIYFVPNHHAHEQLSPHDDGYYIGYMVAAKRFNYHLTAQRGTSTTESGLGVSERVYRASLFSDNHPEFVLSDWKRTDPDGNEEADYLGGIVNNKICGGLVWLPDKLSSLPVCVKAIIDEQNRYRIVEAEYLDEIGDQVSINELVPVISHSASLAFHDQATEKPCLDFVEKYCQQCNEINPDHLF